MMRERVFFTTIIFAWLYFGAGKAVAQPCLSDWTYRVPLSVDNPTSTPLSDFQVVATLNTSALLLDGKVRSDGGDIRVLTSGGTSLPYWIETGTFNTTATRLWIRMPSIPANGSTTLYLFYGNPSAASAGNGNTVFELFDDFTGATLDAAKWTSCGTGATTVSGGKISMTGPTFITAFDAVTGPVTITASVTDYDLTTNGTSFVGLINDGTQTGYMGGARNVAGAARIVHRRIQPPSTCYSFDSETSDASLGPTDRWEFSWPATGEQVMNIGGTTFNGIDNTVAAANDQKVVFGNIDMAGAFAIDFLFARKYSAVDPTVTPGVELKINIPPITATNSGRSCEGQDVQLSVTDVPGATYSWVNAASQIIATTREHTLAGVSAADGGVYTVTVSIPGGCSSSTAQTTVEVDAATVPGTATGDAVVCEGVNTGSIHLSGNTGSVVRWETSQTGLEPWTTINNTTTGLNYTNLISTAYYRAVVKNGVCSEEISNAVSITVDPTTVAGEILGTSEVCDGGNSVDLRVTGKTGDILRWESSVNGTTWITVGGATAQLEVDDLSNTTQYRTVVQSGQCAAKFSQPFTVKVNPLPLPSFTAVPVCEDEMMSFTNTSTISSGSIVATLWEFGDGSSSGSNSPKHAYGVSGQQDVILTATSDAGCTNTLTSQVTVYPKPVISFTAPPTCDGDPAAFVNNSSIASGFISSYEWDFGDGTTSTDIAPEKQFFNAGTYLVSLSGVSDHGCKSELSRNITIDRLPVASATNTGRACEGEDLTLSAADVPGASYSWLNADNNLIATTREHTFSEITPDKAGVYTVIVSIPGGCSNSAQTTVQVDAATVAGTAASDNVVCYGVNSGSIHLTGHTGSIVRWETSSTGADPWAAINNTTDVLNYANLLSTSYYRAVVKNNVCPERASNAIRIAVDSTTVAGEILGTSEVCDGKNSATLRLTGRTGDILRWESSTNGTTWLPVSHTSAELQLNDLNKTTHYRTVVRSGVCPEKASAAFTVTVRPLPQPSFTTTPVCEGEIMTFSNTSTIESGSIAALLWEFGDGSSAASANPNHVYLTSGQLDAVLRATSDAGCTNTFTSQVTIYPRPAIAFSASQTCDGFPTEFDNQSTIASGAITAYDWDFGDGTGSTDVSPEKQYFNAGTYLVTLSGVSDHGCSSKLSRNFTVDQLPIANFTADDVCLGQATLFKNRSSYSAGQMTFEWDFGDGETSVAFSPSHQYDAAATFLAKLIVTTDKGCQDSVSRSVSVRKMVSGSAGPDVTVSKGLGAQLTASGGVSYLWTPAESLNSAVLQNPIATPAETTTYVVTITDQLGCQATDDVVVTVLDDFSVEAMNVLTPNGDGVNDFWEINNIENYGEATVYVYDKTGRKVFSAQGYKNDWQGTSGTDLLPDGTYYYVIQFANTSVAYTGSLTILRND